MTDRDTGEPQDDSRSASRRTLSASRRTLPTSRRTLLRRAGAVAATGAIAGCLWQGADDPDAEESDGGANGADPNDGTGADDPASAPRFPVVEDPPDEVYLPTHRESMRTLDPVAAGDYRLTAMLSYPHRFWLVDGDGTEPVVPDDGRGVHLMFTLRDAATGVALPVESGAAVRLERDGERVGSPRVPWPMLSQQMGFHFGDNVSLPGDGTYAVEVELPPLSAALTGDLAGRFEEPATAAFEFTYDEAFREEVIGGVEYLDEADWGDPGALEPMGAGGGSASLPDADAYPGEVLGAPESGDVVLVTTLLEPGSRFVDGDDRYLLVSPRTPYNAFPLADALVRATVSRDGETVADEALDQAIDGEYGLHYGVALSDIEPGDAVEIAMETPARVARHQGYETAFFDAEPVELVVPGGEP